MKICIQQSFHRQTVKPSLLNYLNNDLIIFQDEIQKRIDFVRYLLLANPTEVSDELQETAA